MPHDLDAMQYQHAADQERELIRDAARNIAMYGRELVQAGIGDPLASHLICAYAQQFWHALLMPDVPPTVVNNYPPAPPEGVGG